MSSETLNSKLEDLQTDLQQVLQQHQQAQQFIAELKEKALTINGAILMVKDLLSKEEEDNPCATGNCPMPAVEETAEAIQTK